MEEEGLEILAENIKKKTSFGRYLLRQKNTNKLSVQKWSRICGMDLSGLGCLPVTGYKIFILQKSSRICFILLIL